MWAGFENREKASESAISLGKTHAKSQCRGVEGFRGLRCFFLDRQKDETLKSRGGISSRVLDAVWTDK